MEYLSLKIKEEEEDRQVLSCLTAKCEIEKALTNWSVLLFTEDEKIIGGTGI